MKNALVLLQTILFFAATITGCGTILWGTHQGVQLDVYPPGTEVSVYSWNGELVAGPGLSPGIMTVQRPRWGEPYVVRASKDGYCPAYWFTSGIDSSVGRQVVTAIAAVLVTLPWFVSMLVDAKTGGCCSMQPDHFQGSLKEDAACTQ